LALRSEDDANRNFPFSFRIFARARAWKRRALRYLVFSLRVARSIPVFPSNLKKVIP